MTSLPVEIVVEHVTLEERNKRTRRRYVLLGFIGILCLCGFIVLEIGLAGRFEAHLCVATSILFLYLLSIACHIMLFSESTAAEIRALDEELLKGYKLPEKEIGRPSIKPVTHKGERTFAIVFLGANVVYLNDPDIVHGGCLNADPTKAVYYYSSYAFVVDLDKLTVFVLYS